MKYQSFLDSLSTSERKHLRQKKNGPGLRRILVQTSLIAFLATLIILKIPGWPILMLPLGILLAFQFTLQHECTHKTPFKTAWLNEWVGAFTGLLILQPFLWFRYFHFEHHRHTNDPQRDPELSGRSKPVNWRDYFIHLSTVYYWRDKIRLLFTNAFSGIEGSYIPAAQHDNLRKEARVMIVLYSLALLYTFFVSTILIWIWIVPLLMGFPFLRLYLLAEHGLCPPSHDKFLNTRTVYTTGLIKFLTWNMPYHIEHHLIPNVPFHRLPHLHQSISLHLTQTTNGYTQFTKKYLSQLKS